MSDDGSIGARIAAERKLRGLTQRQLADRAHVSISLLRKAEQGHRPATAALVASTARALGIDQARLTGQPFFRSGHEADTLHEVIPALRRELSLYGLPPDDQPETPPSLPDLARRVAECSDLVHAVSYVRLGAVLPQLLADLRAASHAWAGLDRARVMRMLFETLDNAKRLAHDLGYPDLGVLAVELEERAAIESEDPLAVAVARGVRAWTLTTAGAYAAAYRLLSDTVDALDEQPDSSPEWLSAWGFLNLQAALASARMGNAEQTWERYEAARHAASQFERDLDHYRLAFGPANTSIWGVGLAVELQDGPGALTRNRDVFLPADLPRARAGHHYMDLARGYLYTGDRQGALGALMTARRIAPQQLRYNPGARETVHALARAEHRRSESLRGLAAWMGIQG